MEDSKKPRTQIEYLARISRGDLTYFSDVFKMGKLKADTYCPTPEEITEIISGDLGRYLPFLLWIDQTGITTEENKDRREYLRSYLYNTMVIKK